MRAISYMLIYARYTTISITTPLLQPALDSNEGGSEYGVCFVDASVGQFWVCVAPPIMIIAVGVTPN